MKFGRRRDGRYYPKFSRKPITVDVDSRKQEEARKALYRKRYIYPTGYSKDMKQTTTRVIGQMTTDLIRSELKKATESITSIKNDEVVTQHIHSKDAVDMQAKKLIAKYQDEAKMISSAKIRAGGINVQEEVTVHRKEMADIEAAITAIANEVKAQIG